MFSARNRPPSNTPPTRCSMSAAAWRGLSPTAIPRMRTCRMTAACSAGSGRSRDSTCWVVRFTIAPSARLSRRDQSTVTPCWGSWERARRCSHRSVSSASWDTSRRMRTPDVFARSLRASRAACMACWARLARRTCARVGHSPSPSCTSSSRAADHSSAISCHAFDHAWTRSRVAASTVLSTMTRMVRACRSVSAVMLTGRGPRDRRCAGGRGRRGRRGARSCPRRR